MADNIDFALNDHFYDFVDDWNYKFYFLVGGYEVLRVIMWP